MRSLRSVWWSFGSRASANAEAFDTTRQALEPWTMLDGVGQLLTYGTNYIRLRVWLTIQVARFFEN